MFLTRLEERCVLSIGGLDVGDVLADAAITGLGPGSGLFADSDELGNGASGDADVDLYRFEAAAGSTLRAETLQPLGSLEVDTQLRLFDAAGNELAFNDDRDFDNGDFFSRLDFNIITAGTYFLGVSGFDNSLYDPVDGSSAFPGETGDYELEIELIGVAAADAGDSLAVADDTGIAAGLGVFIQTEVLGNSPLGAEDVDLYQLELFLGDTLTVETSRPDGNANLANTFIRLFDAAGNQVAFDDDSGPGLYSRLTFEVDSIPQEGTYFLGVSGFPNLFYNPADPGANDSLTCSGDTGDYRLSILVDSGDVLADARQTGVGDVSDAFTRIERLGDGPSGAADIDVYRIEAGVDDVLFAETFLPAGSSDAVDTGVSLFDSAGNLLAFNDDRDFFGGDTYSELQFQFTEPGVYFVVVSGFSNFGFDPVTGNEIVAGDTGDYELELTLQRAVVPAEIRGVKFNDRNANGIRQDGEEGVAGVTIFIDENGNGVLDVLDTFTSNDVPKIIPEQVDPISVSSFLTVSGLTGSMTDLDVALDISHTFDEDLEVILIHPDGTFITLFSGVGGAGEDFDGTVFDDEAAISIAAGAAPFAGRFVPAESLSTFDGKDPNGTWELVVLDSFPSLDGGALHNWSLMIATDQPTFLEPTAVTDDDGSYAFTNLAPGTYRIGEVLPQNFVQTFPAAAATEVFRADFSDAAGAPSTDGFTTTGFVEDQWHLSTGRGNDAGHSSNDSFYFGSGEGAAGGGNYDDDAFGVLTRTVDLTAFSGHSIFLDFNHFLEIEDAFDVVAVSIVGAGGPTSIATDADFGTVSVDPVTFSDVRSTAGFESVTLDISQFAGEVIDVEFTFASDVSINFEGWYIDDVVVRAVPLGLHTVTVASGEIREGVDFGNRFFDPAEIRGTKFHDIDGNGARDAGEPGLAGVTIFLDLNGNGLLDLDPQNPEPSAVTAADGSYVFENLEPGTYIVAEVPPPGSVQTFPATPGTHTLAVAAGDVVENIDFGNELLPVASISGAKFVDLNGNGQRDPGEFGVPGVTVFLDLNGNGELDAERTFESGDVPLAINDLQTTTSFLAVGGLSGNIVDVNVALDITHTFDSDLEVFLISPGGTVIELFSGVGGGGSNFAGTVLDDEAATPITLGAAPFSSVFAPAGLLADFDGENPNGTWQLQVTDTFPGDSGTLNNWSLTILTDNPADGEPQTLTDAAGNYTFAGLFPGTYRVGEILPAGTVPTFPNPAIVGTFDVFRADFSDAVGNPDAEGFTSFGANNQWHLDANRGFDPGHTGQHSFYFGPPGGGVYDSNASGGLLSPVIDLTSLAGQSLFLEFNHFLEIEDFFDQVFVNTFSSTSSILITGDEFGAVDLFGVRSTNGFVSEQIDVSQFGGDQIQVEFRFGSDGSVEFEGWYIDDVAVTVGQPGAGFHTVTLGPGEAIGGIDFGNQGTATIAGTKFFDFDGNGVRDADENGLAGTTIFLDLNSNGQLDGVATFTSADVPQAIPDLTTITSDLVVGGLGGDLIDVNVRVDVAHPFVEDLDLVLISPSGQRVALARGTNFDIFGVNLSGMVFDDEAAEPVSFGLAPYTGRFQPVDSLAQLDGQDPNGLWQLEITDTFALDPGTLLGWSLEFVTTESEPFTTTSPDGTYQFAGLVAGTYTVAEIVQPGIVQTAPPGGTHTVVLADGQTVTGIDFGNQGVRLSGTKFIDLNRNGQRDAGEPGLAGVTIQLFDDQGSLLAQTLTRDDDPGTPQDETGTYLFEVGGGAGSLVVTEVAPDGFVQTFPGFAGNALQEFDFETGAQGFTATGQWHLSTGRALNEGHSPQSSFYFGTGENAAGNGRYANDQFGTLLSPVISLPAGERLFLEFNHFLAIEDFFDAAGVALLTPGGGVLSQLATSVSGGPEGTGALPDFTAGFRHESFDISQFAGQDVRVEFAFFSDFSITFEGWYVDDVAIVRDAPGGSHVVPASAFPAPGTELTGLDFGNADVDQFPDVVVPGSAPNVVLAPDRVTTVFSQLDRPGDVDVFQFVAPQSGFVAVRMSSPDFTIDPFLTLFDANGNFLNEDDDGAGSLDSLLAFEVVRGQNFFVEAGSLFGDETGVYQLEFVSTPLATNVALAGIGGGEFAGNNLGELVQPGQVQVFQIAVPGGAQAGSILTIDLAATPGSQLDTVVTLFDAATGELIETNDDAFSGNFNSRVVRQNVSPGDSFFVAVGGFVESTGAFSLTTRISPDVGDDFPGQVAQAFNLGSVPIVQQNGSIELANDIDAFLISIPAGQEGLLSIELSAAAGSNLDTVLELRNAQTGALIAFNDDIIFPGNLNSRIERQVAGGQQFVVLARGFSTSIGDYTLTAQLDNVVDDFPGEEDLGELDPEALPRTQNGVIERAGDVDVFRIEIPAIFPSQTLQIGLNAAGARTLDPLVRVFNQAGSLIAVNDDLGFNPQTGAFSLNSLTSINVQPGEVFFVHAGAFGSTRGDYQLVFNIDDDFPDVPANARPLASGAAGPIVQLGSIEFIGDDDAFLFTAVADGRLTVRLGDANPGAASPGDLEDAFLTILQEFDNGRFREVARDNDSGGSGASRVVLDVQTGDTFVFLASGFGTETGDYELFVDLTAPGADLGNTFADAALIFNTTAANLGLDPSRFVLDPGDVDIVRFVAREDGTATVGLSPAEGSALEGRLAAFEFIADPGNATQQIPQRIAAGAGVANDPSSRLMTFDVLAGQQYAVQISTFDGTSGAYNLDIRVTPKEAAQTAGGGVNNGQFLVSPDTVGQAVFEAVLAERIAADGLAGEVIAQRLIDQAVTTFLNANGFDPTTAYVIIVLDPADAVATDPASRQHGFGANDGRVNDGRSAFVTADGPVELMILPAAETVGFRVSLAGLGADAVFEATLIPAGATNIGDAIAAQITNVTGGANQLFTERSLEAGFGNLELVLDFTGTGNGSGGPGPTDVGLAFALSEEAAQQSGVSGGAAGLALALESERAVQGLRDELFARLGDRKDAVAQPLGAFARLLEALRSSIDSASSFLSNVAEETGDFTGLSQLIDLLANDGGDGSQSDDSDPEWLRRQQLWSRVGQQAAPGPVRLLLQLQRYIEQVIDQTRSAANDPAIEQPAGKVPPAATDDVTAAPPIHEDRQQAGVVDPSGDLAAHGAPSGPRAPIHATIELAQDDQGRAVLNRRRVERAGRTAFR